MDGEVKLLTLVIPVEDDKRVLLGLKKRGFGEGYYNGFGGKVEPGESVSEAAARELEEESELRSPKLDKRGVLTFHYDDKPKPLEIHVFRVSEYEGVPAETEEMRPEWFAFDEIPFQKMWADDALWYPLFLSGKTFEGEFYFENTHDLKRHELRETTT
ncbi:7,8-dihydro-8-oxoguanine triphosphatase [Chloropicon roscoffensis]|uniref:Oxidized purine nucleoside triphosphate hydrolase n=1 Tax=Chloropicon roscoffensis TaxID=1461544 RepID=A0AAX4PKF1_9CHLO